MPDDVTPAPQVTAPGAVGIVPGGAVGVPAGEPPERVTLTEGAAELLARLRVQYGELMFHQSGGCCDGSSPMCYPQGEFLTSDADVHLGDLVVTDSYSALAEVPDALPIGGLSADPALVVPPGPVVPDPGPAAHRGAATVLSAAVSGHVLSEPARAPGLAGDETRAGGPTFTVPFWMSRNQFEYWKHTHLTVDVVPGRGSGFSVEAPEGVRFMIRSRLFSDEESAALEGQVL